MRAIKPLLPVFAITLLLLVQNPAICKNEWKNHSPDSLSKTTSISTLNIEISRPQSGYLYVFDKKLLRLRSEKTLVIGKITVFAHTTNTLNIKKVDFILDGEVMHTCHYPPYMWTWNTKMYGRGNHLLQIIATDQSDTQTMCSSNVTVISLRKSA
ncbi:MAG TPA: hypothetical protein ENI42_05260 [Thermoplasmatales archaeon]|nr:hypothetical protein [Thermoplasmatales archaeon]